MDNGKESESESLDNYLCQILKILIATFSSYVNNVMK